MNRKELNPAAGRTADGARDASLDGARPEHSTGTRAGKAVVTVRVPPDGAPFTVSGRLAQTLALLLTTGARGFTSEEARSLSWARRPSAYVHSLRRFPGVSISTVSETTPDGGRVARYRLVGPVVLMTPPPKPE